MLNSSPSSWRKDVVLTNGTTLRLRPISPEDDERMLRLFGRLSPETVYRRFFTLLHHMSLERVQQFTHIDLENEMALVGVIEDQEEPEGERIIAVGRYVRLPRPTRAEVAFTVDDAFQGLGIGTHLLQALLPFARMAEIEVLEAEVLAENRRMIAVFRNMGFSVSSTLREGVSHIEFPLGETELVQDRRWAREQTAHVQAMERLFRPRAVAVIGASNTPGTIGHALVRNLVEQPFAGAVYPVNPKHRAVHSVPCLSSIHDIPGEVDLALVAVPAAQVLSVVRECAEKHVYALAILSAGFSETGPEGEALQAEVLELAQRYGMRLVGPNCLGLINTAEDVRLNATFAPVYPPPGKVALGSQSGALGIAMLNLARDLRLGISQFIGLGNKADISGNDLLYFWGADPATRVILLYLESFGNPRKFSRIARRVSRDKPIVVLKGGASPSGARGASSHTGALAASDVVVGQLLRQTGVVRTHTMEQFFHAARVLGSQPLPRGPRLALLTNAGGPGILSADRAEAENLSVPGFSDSLRGALREKLAASAGVANPVDMTAAATPQQYEDCLRLLLLSDEVDLVLVMFLSPLMATADEVASAILAARRDGGADKPLLACMMGAGRGLPCLDELEAAGIPTFRFPEDAVLALAQLTRYGEWRNKPRGEEVLYEDVATDEARALILAHAGEDPNIEPVWLPPEAAFGLMAHYGIPTLPIRPAHSPEEAIEGAAALGFPIRMKSADPLRRGSPKTRRIPGGAKEETQVRRAFEAFQDDAAHEEPSSSGSDPQAGVLLQPDAERGLDAVIGMRSDALFGPVLMAGLGGAFLELFGDVRFALHPIAGQEAEEMLRGLRAWPLFEGYRGEPPRDVRALGEVLLRLSQLVKDHPQVREVEMNPVRVLEEGRGCVVLDVRVQVAPVDPFTEFVISALGD